MLQVHYTATREHNPAQPPMSVSENSWPKYCVPQEDAFGSISLLCRTSSWREITASHVPCSTSQHRRAVALKGHQKSFLLLSDWQRQDAAS